MEGLYEGFQGLGFLVQLRVLCKDYTRGCERYSSFGHYTTAPYTNKVPQQGPNLHNPPYRVWIGVCEFYKIEEVWNLGASGGLCRGFTMALVPSHARFVGTRCGNVKEFGVAFRDLGVGFRVYGLGLGGSWDLVPSKGGYSI